MGSEPSLGKFKWCKAILIFTTIVLSIRLWDLQIMKGSEMRIQSEQNRIRVKKIIAPRGIIFDRQGRILADSRPSFNLYIIPEDIKDFSHTIDGLAKLIHVDRETIVEKLKMSSELPPSFPVKIKSDITMDEVAIIEANRVYLPGVNIQIEPRRTYLYGTMLAHVLGYIAEISSEELKSKEYKNCIQGDFIGKYGIEKMYETYLRGVDGERRVEVDASGREIRTLESKESLAGNNLYLNIDIDIQTIAEKALEGKRGAVIVLEPKNGAVFALVSKPSFDPNKFSTGISKNDWKTLSNDKAYPLQNRVIQGRYPPGSTFKIVSALKALEDGVITEKTNFFCSGHLAFGSRVFGCWKKDGHGHVAIHRGIVESCDVFFYNVGLKLGINRIHNMAEAIGLGKLTGIDLPGEKQGLVPSSEWKNKVFGKPWYDGETLSVVIGQGAVWLTPVQLAQLSSFVANQGVTFKPQIVKRVVRPDGRVIKTFEPAVSTNIKLKKTTIDVVKEGMKGVVNEQRGTAYSSRIQNIKMSGKTGTAQLASLEKSRNIIDHAWFISYAPAEDPAVSISVLVEHGGHGSGAAAPIAKAITENLMKEKTIVREAKALENR